MRSSSGEWRTASCPSIDRAKDNASSVSPVNSTLVKRCRDTGTGSRGTVWCALVNRRSEIAHNGSRSSTGLVCGGMKSRAARRVVSPIRTRAKSSWPGLRSHSRVPRASAHRSPGGGLSHNKAARWSSAACRACLRFWLR